MTRLLLSIGVVHVLTMLVSLARAKTLSVLLGPADFGVVSTVDQAVLSVVQLGALSLPFTAMKYMSQGHSEGPEQFERAFVAFLRTLAGLSLVAVAVVAGLLWWHPGLFGADLAPFQPLFLLGLLGVPAAMLHIHYVNTWAAAQRGAASAWLNFAVGLTLAASAIAGFLWLGIPGLLGGSVVGGAVASLVSLRHLTRALRLRLTLPAAGILRELRRDPRIISISLMLYAAMSAYSLTMLATRYHVFGQLGAESAGFLQAHLGIALAVGSVITPLNGLFFAPLVNRRIPVAEKAEAADRFAGTVTLVLLVGGLVVTLFPSLALTVLYSPEFAVGAPWLFWFVIWQSLYQLTNIYLQLLIGLDDVRFFTVLTLVGYGVSALLFGPLITRFGIGGAALALSAAMVVSGVGAAVRLRRRFAASIAPTVLLRGIALLILLAGAGLLFTPTGERTVAGVALRAAYAAGSLVLAWLTLPRSERLALLATFSRRRAPARP